jgi:molecular chaperone Hsp33
MMSLPMSDHLVRGIIACRGLRLVYARVTDTARIARMLHGCYPTAASLFAEALAAGVLLGALQKDRSRVNLQLECDGPLGGLFVDSDTDGNVRGYVRRPEVNFPGEPRAGMRAALGRSGFLSVLRDFGGGNLYRGSVELGEDDLAGYLRRYFSESEQIETALDLRVARRSGEPLGEVAGILAQKLPDGSSEAMRQIEERLAAGALGRALEEGAAAQEVIRQVAGEDFELLADLEVAYRCSCNPQRARAAVSALGIDGIHDVLAKEKEAVITCQFCRQRYVLSEAELRQLVRRLEGQGPAA